MIQKLKWSNHDEWLAIRHKYIGGSDAGTVVGLNEYSSPYKLWAEKTDRIPPFEGNTITEVGSFLEDFVAQQFEKMTGKQVRRTNFTYVNDRFPWACANVDRLVSGSKEILEIKTTSNYEYIKKLKAGEIIGTWWAQILHYMTVLEVKKAYLAVLVDCREVIIKDFDFDEAESEALMSAESNFWYGVCNDIPPAMDGSEATTEALRTIYAESSSGRETDLTAVGFHLQAYESLNRQIAELTEQRDAHQAEVMNFMQDAEKGKYGAYSVSWKTQQRKTFDRKAYEQDHGPIGDQYYRVSTSRPFKITVKGK